MSTQNGEPKRDRTLLVLGAGASIGAAKYPIENSFREQLAKMPSGENFFHDLFLTRPERPPLNFLPYLTSEGLYDLIVRVWGLGDRGLDPEEWKGINIEDVFTFLDLCEHMFPKGTKQQQGARNARRQLERFITFVLSAKSDGMHCEHLLDLLFRLKPSDTIISFNWDTIADFTIMRAQEERFSAYVKLMTAERVRLADFRDSGLLLKLHGSLNWNVCPNTKCALLGKIRLGINDGKLLRFLGVHKCPACGNDRGEPFIVPPTSQKLIKQGTPLYRLWLLARQQLIYCSRMIFIGYSFPNTDFYSEWLFRHVHLVQGSLPEVVIVNPDAMQSRSPLTRRYERIFKGCKLYKFRTLEDFRENGRELLEHRPLASFDSAKKRKKKR